MPTAHEQEQEDRRAYLENEKLLREKAAEERRASTYLAHALFDAEAIGGRFAAVGKASVTGASPTQTVLPAPSWAGQDLMDEPPTGYEIDAQEPTGSLAEQAIAQQILDQRSAALPADGGPADVPASSSLAAVELAGLPTSSKSSTLSPTAAKGDAAPSEVVVAASPPSSQPLAALQTTPVTRGPAATSLAQRSAGPRTFQRRL